MWPHPIAMKATGLRTQKPRSVATLLYVPIRSTDTQKISSGRTGWGKCLAAAPVSWSVLSPPLTLFALFSAATFLLLLVLFLKHNQSAYKRQYSQWEHSFLPTMWHGNLQAGGLRVL